MTLQRHLAERLDADADRRALAFYDRSRTATWISYSDLLAGAAGAAGTLAEAGARRGEPCVIVAGNDRFSAEALLGVLMLGGVPLLVAPPSIQGANSSLAWILAGIVDRVAPAVVVAADPKGAPVDQLGAHHPEVRFLVGRDDLPATTGDPAAMVLPGDDDVAAMQLTSGTTGFPRICVWKQHSVTAAFDGMAGAMGVGTDDLFVNWTPLYHDMGLINNFLMCVTRGIPLVMLSPFDFVKDPSIWLHAISDTGATTSWSPNFGFAITAQRVIDVRLDGVRLDHVRGLWNAAEKIHLATMEAFADRFAPFGLGRTALRTNFGCAENIGGATFTRAGEPFRHEAVDAAALHERQVAIPAEGAATLTFVGCGAPHPGIKLSIVDGAGGPLPDGHVGELAMETTSRMEGYLDDPESTAEAIRGPLLKTGDLGYLRHDEFFWTGRLRERITVRGRKIDPSDFEALLLEVPGLRPGAFTVFGVDDDAAGTQRVVVVAEVRPDGDRETVIATTQRASFDRLGVAVDDIVLVEPGTLTKTSSGKRRNRHFRDAYLRGELDVPLDPPPVFDPGSDLFVAQFDRPSNLQPVNMRALSPFHRALLVIDGTVTTFLEAYTLEPIEVVKVGQAVQELAADSPWLALDAGDRVIARQVTLTGRYTGRVYAHAHSMIAVDRLPAEMVAGLDDTGGGLGRILNAARAENRREILWYGRERATEGGLGGDLIVRTYRIIQGGDPIMLISEKFPTGEAGQPAHE